MFQRSSSQISFRLRFQVKLIKMFELSKRQTFVIISDERSRIHLKKRSLKEYKAVQVFPQITCYCLHLINVY